MRRRHRAPSLPRPDHATLRERLDEDLSPLWLYGAGHVGQALARIVAELPLRLTWIDTRAELFPLPIPEGVRRGACPGAGADGSGRAGRDPLSGAHAQPSARLRAVQARSWNVATLPGSADWFQEQGRTFSFAAGAAMGWRPRSIARLVCPIGARGIDSKWPAAIAVAVGV